VFLNTTSTKNFATAGALNVIACWQDPMQTFCSRDAKHQCVLYSPNGLPVLQHSSLNNKALKNVGCIWYAPFVIRNKSLYQKRILLRFAKAPQPFRPGGSSQFQYYPHLLALSNPKKSLGACPEIKSQYGGFVLTGGRVSEIEALSPARPPTPPPSLNNKALKNVGCIWYAPFVIKNKSLYQKRILPRFAKAPQPFRPGGSSQFQYYPHLRPKWNVAMRLFKGKAGSAPAPWFGIGPFLRLFLGRGWGVYVRKHKNKTGQIKRQVAGS
jgi:hypothetical protein